jgi:hypothetical protein
MIKKVSTVVLASLLIITAGCSTGTGPVVTQAPAPPSQSSAVNEDILEEYQVLLDREAEASELAVFMGEKISRASEEDAEKMLQGLIATMLRDITGIGLSEKVNSLTMDQVNDPGSIEDEELRDIINGIYAGMYMLYQAEGTYEIKVDYGRISEEYGIYATERMKEYLLILAEDSDKPFAMDAELTITLEELAGRTAKACEYVNKYGDFSYSNDIGGLYAKYLRAYLLGLDNTPAFGNADYRLKADFKESYEKSAADYEGTPFGSLIKEYLDLLEGSLYMLTKEITGFAADKAIPGC